MRDRFPLQSKLPPSTGERERLLELLRSNQGFPDPDQWIEYALDHGFQKVGAERLHHCPECESREFIILGQNVFFSTLSRLRECLSCGLVYSDARIDPQVVRAHFEQSYKEENYFRVWRKAIVEQIAALVDCNAPRGGRVLDVGGATGFLMAVVREKRPDLNITICELSAASCEAVASQFGFTTICGSLTQLDSIKEPFDVVVMSDVIYYEQDLPRVWRALAQIVGEGGSVIIRVPNTLGPIHVWSHVSSLFQSQKAREMADRIPFFTPDHFFVFSRRFLTSRLRRLGFSPIEVMPSKLLTPNRRSRYLNSVWYYLARGISGLTFGRLITTPSTLYVARRPLSKVKPAASTLPPRK